MGRVGLGPIAVALALVVMPAQAAAGKWDPKLSRLCFFQTNDGSVLPCGRSYDFESYGGLAGDSPVIADNESFRSLMSELGTIFAPGILSPAETVGFGGFTFGIDLGVATINPYRQANLAERGKRLPFWRAAEAVSDAALAAGDSLQSEEARRRLQAELPSRVASTVTVMARKGLWFPFPSSEIAVGVRHLLDSRMLAAMLLLKLALHEGFQGWPVPAFAVRGGVTRVFNTPRFDLTVTSFDLSVSKAFGLRSTFNLTPYGGYQLLWIIADSGLVDSRPSEPAPQDLGALGPERYFTFVDQASVLRHRLFLGARFSFYFASVLAEFSYFLEGQDSDLVQVPPDLQTVNVSDRAGAQYAFNLALAVDF